MVVENLDAFYGSNQALHGINLAIPERKVTAIIGPSGGGKSTLIRCLNRMHETSLRARVSGRVTLDGEDIYEEDATLIRRRIGMVFQKPNPFATMSIYNNVSAPLRFNGRPSQQSWTGPSSGRSNMPRSGTRSKIASTSAATSLSGGQQQRLRIARALAADPEVLLMDEPCSALDPIATAKIEDLIGQLKNDYTVVIVTHNMQQAARVADYTAFLYLGKPDRVWPNGRPLRATERIVDGILYHGAVRMKDDPLADTGALRGYDLQIRQLKDRAVRMGESAFGMVHDGVARVYDQGDLAAAQTVLDRDTQLDHFDEDMEHATIAFLVLR